MKSLVIIPTYDEAETIEALLSQVLALNFHPDVLIVDDNSPDGTGAIVDRLAARDSRVQVLHRPGKLGLGTAYVAGFRYAIVAGYDAVVQMDGDGQHRPEYLPVMIDALRDSDLAIGSRYTDGGEAKNWAMLRQLISRSGNTMAQRVLGLPVNDATSGLRAYRIAVLQAVDLEDIKLEGYGFQVAMVHAAVSKGFRVREVPIHFDVRRAGKSKMSAGIIVEAMLFLVRARLSGVRPQLARPATTADTPRVPAGSGRRRIGPA